MAGVVDPPSFVFRNHSFRIHNEGGPSYAQAPDNLRVTVQYFVDEINVSGPPTLEAMTALLGYTRIANLNGQNYYSRVTPHTPDWHPDLNGKVYCKQITDAKPLGALTKAVAGDPPRFTSYLLTTVYERLPYDVLEDAEVKIHEHPDTNVATPCEAADERYMSIDEKDASQTLLSRGGCLIWKNAVDGNGSPRVVDVGQPVFIPITEMVVTWYGVPKFLFPEDALNAARGKVNSHTVLRRAPGTLLFRNWSTESVIMGNREKGYNVKMNLHHYPNGANYYPDPERGWGFYPTARRSTGADGPYDSYNFIRIFWPG